MHSILKHELAKFSCQFAEITRSSTERKIGEDFSQKNQSIYVLWRFYDRIVRHQQVALLGGETNLTIIKIIKTSAEKIVLK